MEINQIFSSVDLILNVNDDILASLEERMKNWSDTQLIGDIFLDFVIFCGNFFFHCEIHFSQCKKAPYLKLYSQYTINYDLAIKTLDNCRSENSKFKDFLAVDISLSFSSFCMFESKPLCVLECF